MVFRSGSGSGIGVGDRWRRALGAASALGAACLILSLLLPLFSTPCRAAAAAGAEATGKAARNAGNPTAADFRATNLRAAS